MLFPRYVGASLALIALSLPATAQYTPYFQDFESFGSPTNQVLLTSAGTTTTSSNFALGLQNRVIKQGINANVGVADFSTLTKSWSGENAIQYAWRNKINSLVNMYVRATTRDVEALMAPTIDLAGAVAFSLYVDPGLLRGAPQTGLFDLQVSLGIIPKSTVSENNQDALGQRGYSGNGMGQTIYYVGNSNIPPGPDTLLTAPDPLTGGVFAPGGTFVKAGVWQRVIFRFATARHDQAQGHQNFPLSGLGVLDSINFTPINPVANQIFVVYLDDFAILPARTLRGRVTLQECPNGAYPLSMQFRPQDGSAPFARPVLPQSDGTFQVEGIPAGEYTLAIKGNKYLQRTLTDVDLMSGDVNDLKVFLLAGDANNDNTCDIFDLATLAEAFDTIPENPNWNENADFNCNGAVELFDLALLAENFNTDGDL